MSTILKALQRLEEEKAAAAPRELREELAAARTTPSRARLWLPAAAVALLAAGIGWWSWPRAAEPSLAPPAVAQQSPPPTAATARPPAGVSRVVEPEEALAPERLELPERPPQGMPEQAFSSPVEVVARPAAKPRIPLEDPRAPGPRAPAEQVEAAAPATRPDAGSQESVARPPATASAATPRPEPARPTPTAVAGSALPLRVEKTLWHPKPERREALVAVGDGAPRVIHEGERIAGVRVAEIQPSGVVFEREGETIHRRVGEP